MVRFASRTRPRFLGNLEARVAIGKATLWSEVAERD
jgi:hypothetical protein